MRDYRGNIEGHVEKGIYPSKGRRLMRVGYRAVVRWGAALALAVSLLASAQTAYQPKFPGDPARSDSEAVALGYMRTVLRAQRLYKKKHDHFAASLAELVHTGSFTRRMTNTTQGEYTVGFRSHKDGFELTMTPNQMDAEHRSFYATDDGQIHADETKPADDKSPVVK
jgi:hypothetical protein